MRRRAWIITAILLSTGVSSSAWSYEASWSVTGEGEDSAAIDCSDCEEELGIIIACKGKGMPAEVTVNAAASEKGKDGAEAPFTISVDGDAFTRTARTVEFGMIGFTPVFSMAPGDPIVKALQTGEHHASVAFNGGVTPLNLKGAREALESFKERCGWIKTADAGTKDAGAKDASDNSASAQKPIASATFKCAEDKSIDATFYPDDVDLKLGDSRAMKLPQVISGSGARYANEDESFVFWNKGDTAFVTEGADDKMTFKDCVSGR